jgi:RNA polymerase sigma-70 factor (ECF subfamily)
LAEQREQSLLLADALERLPPPYRDVLIDRHIQGLKFAEIAEKSQRAVSTIEKRWMNAIQALRRQMKSVGE